MRKLPVFIGVLSASALPYVATVTPGYAAETDEIIVSVRRRDENLQEIPLAVSTIGSETIERFGIDSVDDVTKYTAGLEFDEGFGAQDTRIVIRGLSPTRGRANVAFLVDGVDFTGEAVSTAGGGVLVNQSLLDVERVEIVKGPQSALYGRSAFAGAIQYITKKPNLEAAEGDFDIAYGTSGEGGREVRFGAGFGGPITDNFGLRVNGIVFDETGHYENSITGQTVGGSDGHGLALSGLWDAGDDFTISGRVAYSEENYETRAQARVYANAAIDIDQSRIVQQGPVDTLIYTSGLGTLLGNGGAQYPDCQPMETNADNALTSCLGTPKVVVVGKMPDRDQLTVVQSDDPRTGGNYPGTEIETLTSTLALKWDRDFGTFASYTGYANVESDQFFDGQRDALPAGSYTSLDGTYSFTLDACGFGNCSPTVQEVGFQNETNLFSQEFRFSSNLDGPINYTVGALYWKERVRQFENGTTIAGAVFRANPAFPPPPGTPPPPPPASPPVESLDPGNMFLTQVFEPTPARAVRNTESKSIYGLIEWDINEAWKFSAEARWVDEELLVAGSTCNEVETAALNGFGCNPQTYRGTSSVDDADGTGSLPAGQLTKAFFGLESREFSDSFIAPKITLEWTPSDDHLIYGSIAQGVKPGGISTITAGTFFKPEENVFDKEELLAYEIGTKSTLADGALTLNTAFFYQDYTDKQVGVSKFDPDAMTDFGAIENAGEAVIRGVELEASWAATDYLTLSGAYTYVDAEYTSFQFETGSANNVARSLAGGGGGCLAVIDGNPDIPGDDMTDNCLVSLNGYKVEDIPENAFVGNVRYEAPLAGSGDTEWYADASFIFTDERYIDEWNLKTLDKYWLVDLRLGLIKDNYEFTFFVDNAFDDKTARSAVDFGSIIDTVRQGQFPPAPTDGVIVSVPDPRVFGIRMNVNFGG